MSVTDIGLSWSKAETLVSLGIGRTFAVFQILGTCRETKKTFKICVITGVSSRAYPFQNQKGRSSGPVAVLFTCANTLKTDISWITGTLWSSGITSSRAGSTKFMSLLTDWKWVLISFTLNEDDRFIFDPTRPVNLSVTFHQDLPPMSGVYLLTLVRFDWFSLISWVILCCKKPASSVPSPSSEAYSF